MEHYTETIVIHNFWGEDPPTVIKLDYRQDFGIRNQERLALISKPKVIKQIHVKPRFHRKILQ